MVIFMIVLQGKPCLPVYLKLLNQSKDSLAKMRFILFGWRKKTILTFHYVHNSPVTLQETPGLSCWAACILDSLLSASSCAVSFCPPSWRERRLHISHSRHPLPGGMVAVSANTLWCCKNQTFHGTCTLVASATWWTAEKEVIPQCYKSLHCRCAIHCLDWWRPCMYCTMYTVLSI